MNERTARTIGLRILARPTNPSHKLLSALLGVALLAACQSEPVVAEPMHFIWGETLTRSAASVPGHSTVEMVFHLPVPMEERDPLPVRLIDPESGTQSLQATFVGEAFDRVHITIDGDWLVPGRHIIEVKTREHVPLPLRRFAVVIE
jgi:hypothetical protein